MEGFTSVAHLCHAAYIDHAGLVFALCQNSIADIGCSGDIGLACGNGAVVGLRRYHTAHVQHDVATRYAAQDTLIVCQISPDDFHLFLQGCQQGFVFCARTRQYAQCISFRIAQYLLHTRISHSARSTGKENCLFHRKCFLRLQSYCFLSKYATESRNNQETQ